MMRTTQSLAFDGIGDEWCQVNEWLSRKARLTLELAAPRAEVDMLKDPVGLMRRCFRFLKEPNFDVSAENSVPDDLRARMIGCISGTTVGGWAIEAFQLEGGHSAGRP